MSQVRFPKGTVITCPQCKAFCGCARRDIVISEPVSAAAWKGLKAGERMTCHACGTPYMRYENPNVGMELHTKQGWK